MVTETGEGRRPAAGMRIANRVDLFQVLFLAALAGSVLVMVGSQLHWARVDLPAIGPLPARVEQVDGSSPGQHGGRILVLGVVMVVACAASLLLRPMLLKTRRADARTVAVAASIVLVVLSLAVVVLALREVQTLRDTAQLATNLGLGFLTRDSTPEAGLPLVFAGAGISIVASATAGVSVLAPRRRT